METIILCIIDRDRNYTEALAGTIAALYRGFRIVTPAVDGIIGRAAPSVDPVGRAAFLERAAKADDGSFTDMAACVDRVDPSERETCLAQAATESDVILADVTFAEILLREGGAEALPADCMEKIVLLTEAGVDATDVALCGITSMRGQDDWTDDAHGAVDDRSAAGLADRCGRVDKYGGCAAIVAAVRLKYALITKKPLLGRGDGEAELLSFFGLEGGAGTSSVALGTARELCAYRDRTAIYLSMEAYESKRLCPTGRTAEGDMSDYLYFFLRGDRARLQRLRDVLMPTDEFGVRRFYPGGGFNALRELRDEEWDAFIAGLCEGGTADYLIIDWGNGFDARMTRYLPLSRYCVMVTRRDGVKSTDRPEWRRRVARTLGVAADRLAFVINFADEDEAPANESEGRDGAGFAPEYPGSGAATEDRGEPWVVRIGRAGADFRAGGDGVEIGLRNEFGRGVKQLADRLSDCGAPCAEEPNPRAFGRAWALEAGGEGDVRHEE